MPPQSVRTTGREMAATVHENSLQTGYLLHWRRIERVLGQAGFGMTYLAHDQNLDPVAAINEYIPAGMAAHPGRQR